MADESVNSQQSTVNSQQVSTAIVNLNLDRFIFIDYLETKRSERLLIIELGRFTGIDNVIEVDGNRVRLLYPPEELIFMS